MIQVIDQDLISSALQEGTQLVTSDDSGINGDTLADIAAKATELRLSFKNVLEIDNLQGFHALRTLCLDNNIIKCMKNLDHLVNLTWGNNMGTIGFNFEFNKVDFMKTTSF